MLKKVNIILSDTGWILEKLAKEISSRIKYVTYSNEVDTESYIQYYMTYGIYKKNISPIEIGYFTHIENDEYTKKKFFDVASLMTHCVCHSKFYENELIKKGIKDVTTISPGVDLNLFKPKLKIGVVGRTYPSGRKGEKIIQQLMALDWIEWNFTGEGWPNPALNLSSNELASFYRHMDYILVSSLYEGGPMCVPEALASGTEVIAPPIGWVCEFPHIEYKTGDVDSLRNILTNLYQKKINLRNSVLSYTWDSWAKKHDILFTKYLNLYSKKINNMNIILEKNKLDCSQNKYNEYKKIIYDSYLLDSGHIRRLYGKEAQDLFEKDPILFLMNNPMAQTHPCFDPYYYTAIYKDILKSEIIPLYHYIKFGCIERRCPNPYFDPNYYQMNFCNPLKDKDLLYHYLKNFSQLNEIQIHPVFNQSYYLKKNPDLQKHGINPLYHFLAFGIKENRLFSSIFKLNDIKEDNFYLNFLDGQKEPEILSFRFKNITNKTLSKKKDPSESFLDFSQKNLKKEFQEKIYQKKFEQNIKFTILFDIQDITTELFFEVYGSILEQTYQNYEIIIYNYSLNKKINNFFIENNYTHKVCDTRVEALKNIQGDFLIFIEENEILNKNCFSKIFINIKKYNSDILYCDHIEDFNNEHKIYLKSGWSPELLLSYFYITSFTIINKRLYDKVLGLDTELEYTSIYDLFLRASEHTSSICHIPEVLFHKKHVRQDFEIKRVSEFKKVLSCAYKRRGINVSLELSDWAKKSNILSFVPFMDTDGSPVTIVIPTRNNVRCLITLLQSIQITDYKNYSILIIDNGSDDPFTLKYLSSLPYQVITIKNSEGKFNFSEICNKAIKFITTEFILFLNDDTSIIDPHWLSRMMGFIQMHSIGVVGARLLYPDRNKVQHSGLSTNLKEGMTLFKGLDINEEGYLGYSKTIRNTCAVTGACLLTKKIIFQKLGGFNQKEFAVAYSDTDFCLRVVQNGYRVVYCGASQLFHHELYSRPKRDDPKEIACFIAKYKNFSDPYFSKGWNKLSPIIDIVPYINIDIPNNISKSILFITHNLSRQGASLSLFYIASTIKNKFNYSVSVIAPTHGPLAEDYHNCGINIIIDENISLLKKCLNIDEYNKKIEEIFKNNHLGFFDLIFVNTVISAWGISVGKRYHIPTILNIREHSPDSLDEAGFPNFIKKDFVSNFNYIFKIIFVSKTTMDNWKIYNINNNFELIKNAISPDFVKKINSLEKNKVRKILSILDNEIVFLSVGTICSRKGQHDLVFCLILLAIQIKQSIKIIFVGDSNNTYGNALVSFINSLPIEIRTKIILIPSTKDIHIYYKAADVYICNAREESYPRTILEAMASGLPIITTPVAGIVEQVRDNYNAFFYDPKNINMLYQKILSMLSENQRKDMSNKSKILYETFEHFDDMIAMYLEYINQSIFSSYPKN